MPASMLPVVVVCLLLGVAAAVPNGTLPAGPLNIGYYESWKDNLVTLTTTADLDLANIPGYVNMVILSFLQPDCSYTKGQTTWTGTGLLFSNTPQIIKQGVALLKARQPNTRVLVSVGGSAYTNWVGLSTSCIQAFVEDFDLDGIDLDYEPSGVSCSVVGGVVACNTDAQSVAVTQVLRELLPQPMYLMGAATWHIGMYGEGAFAKALPRFWSQRGVNLAMAKSAAGQQIDFVSIMAYLAGNKTSTGFDWAEAYSAHKTYWPTQAIAIGSMVPPEPSGGHSVKLSEVTDRALYAQANARGAGYGHMIWSMHLNTGCPGPQHVMQAVCRAYNMSGCDTPLPYYTIKCSGAEADTPVLACSGSSWGQCGTVNGMCCAPGLCCSQWGWCGATDNHCGTGCQAWAGQCGITVSPSPSPTPPTNSQSPPPSNDTCTKISTDGYCGHKNGACCPRGGCCSFYGICGTTRLHCYRGCQQGFGQCWPQDPNCSTYNRDQTCGFKSGVAACCPADLCCSSYGYCGYTTTHCSIAQGCKVGLGNCTSP